MICEYSVIAFDLKKSIKNQFAKKNNEIIIFFGPILCSARETTFFITRLTRKKGQSLLESVQKSILGRKIAKP